VLEDIGSMSSSCGSNSSKMSWRVVRAVVVADTGMVAADDEVRAAVVLRQIACQIASRGPA